LPRFFVLSDARDRRLRTLRRHYGPDLLRQNGSNHQVSHAHQIVGCASERENPIHFQCAAVPQFAQQRDGLQPAEAFFDALPLLLAEGIARLSRGAAVDGTAASSSGVLRYVRCHAQVATLAHEFRGVVALVAAHGHTPPSRNVLQHIQCGVALGFACHFPHPAVHDQSMAILHQQIPAVTQLGLFALAFARQQRLRIAFRLVGLVRALLPVKIYRGIPRIIRRTRILFFFVLRLKLFRLAHASSSVPSCSRACLTTRI